MGGFGSGRGDRPSVAKRTTLAALGRLDVRWLHRQGYLDGQEHWTIVRCGRSWSMLTMRCQQGGLVIEPWPQVIPLAWTPCHYGGTRPWLRCPRCARRQAVLYVRYTVVLCRSCLRVPYTSQCTTAEDRLYEKVRRIRTRLGASHNLTELIRPSRKPKGMHWATWERLRAQEQALQAQIRQVLIVRLAAMLGHD